MRGQLNLIILSTLKDENKYGLQIIKDIKDKTGGKIELKLPSLYSSLKRLEQSGYISSYWEKSEIGGNRRYSSITEKGRAYLEDNTESWDLSQSAVAEVLNVKPSVLNKTNNELSIQPDFFGVIDDDKFTQQNENTTETNKEITPPQLHEELNNFRNDSKNENSHSNINPNSFLFDKKDNDSTDSNKNNLDNIDFASIFSDIMQEENHDENNIETSLNNDQNNFKNENRINEVFNFTKDSGQVEKTPTPIDKYLIKDKNPIDDKYKINILHKKKMENEVPDEIYEPTKPQIQVEETLNPLELLNDNNLSLKKYLQNLTENGIKFSIYNEGTRSAKNSKSDFVAINKIQLTTSIFSALLIILQLVVTFALFNIYEIHNDNLVYILSLSLVLFYVFISATVYGINPNLKRKRKELKPQLKIRIFIMLSLWLIIFAINLFCGMRVNAILNSLVYIIVPMILALNVLIDYLIRQIILTNSK